MLSNYDTLARQEKLLTKARPDFPPLDIEQSVSTANSYFKPYLFFKRERAEGKTLLWCSRCGEAGEMEDMPRTVTQVEQWIMCGKHNDEAVCPFCGGAVTLKETHRLGKRRNLVEYQPIVFLTEKDGELWARAYWALKEYQGALNAMPEFKLTYAYHFAAGYAEAVSADFWDGKKIITERLEGRINPKAPVIAEPFRSGSGCFSSLEEYHVVGMEAIERSGFKYCQYDRYAEDWEYHLKHTGKREHLMRYLAAYSIYPRQVEMLMKAGGDSIVDDLVCGYRKNKDIIKWEEADPCAAFGLNKTELRAWRESRAGFTEIKLYKRLKKAGLRTEFAVLKVIADEFTHMAEEFINDLIGWEIKPEKAMRYLGKHTGPRCYGAYFGYPQAYRLWKDYLVMAERLGYDTHHPAVLMPKALEAKHDEAAAAINARREREEMEQNALLRAEAAERLAAWHKRYDVEAEGYFIRVADSAEEITAEGRALEHCVGGYAQRHMQGKTTILFLRRCVCPEASLYTIEMSGTTLVQIHGFRNDRDMKDPRKTMAWLLDPWLNWLRRGSPRDEQGVPKLKLKKEEQYERITA